MQDNTVSIALIIVMLVLVVGGGVAAFFTFQATSEEQQRQQEEQAEADRLAQENVGKDKKGPIEFLGGVLGGLIGIVL